MLLWGKYSFQVLVIMRVSAVIAWTFLFYLTEMAWNHPRHLCYLKVVISNEKPGSPFSAVLCHLISGAKSRCHPYPRQS